MAQKAKKPPEDRALEQFIKPPKNWLQPHRSKIIIVVVVAAALAGLTILLWPSLTSLLRPSLPWGLRVTRFWAAAVVGATFIIIGLLVYFVAERTLWDLLQLLIIPLGLVVIGTWFTVQQENRQRDIEAQRAQDAALQAYLDQMSSFMLNKDRTLGVAQEGDPVLTLARARTSTVIQTLDEDRTRSVLRFLKEADLMGKDQSSIAILATADLRGAHLANRNLRDLDLNDTDLSYADLRNADLRGADLTDADLSHADLDIADLRNVDLRCADLSGTTMLNATMDDATKLEDVDVRHAEIWSIAGGDADFTKKILRVAAHIDFARFGPEETDIQLGPTEPRKSSCPMD